MRRFQDAPGGKYLPDPGFAGDDGQADEGLRAALAAWADGAGADAVYVALLPARVLIPVIAVTVRDASERGTSEERERTGGTVRDASERGTSEERERTGGTVRDASERGTSEERERTAGAADAVIGAEKATDMALPTIIGADGRTAVPAFTSLTSMAAWRADARPVPVAATTAALATVAEQAQLLVIDPGGPVTFRVEGPALRALAQSRVPRPPRTDPDVLAALGRIAQAEDDLAAAVLFPPTPGQDSDAVLGLVLRDGLSLTDAPAIANRIAQALAAEPVLRERLDRGLDLALLPPGVALPAGGAAILVDRTALVG
ncbi:MAG: SseB family protein [Sporichthyaceae bacterium]